jgi:hypothetical protein
MNKILTIGITAAGCLGVALSMGQAARAAQSYVSGVVNIYGYPAVPSASYTVQHPQKGVYWITFTPPFRPYPVCLVVPVGSDAHVQQQAIGHPRNPVSCAIYFADPTDTLEDTGFDFIAVGMSH